jgi:hypothetical protein
MKKKKKEEEEEEVCVEMCEPLPSHMLSFFCPFHWYDSRDERQRETIHIYV